MIGRTGEWRKGHFKRDPERRLDAYAAAAGRAGGGAYTARRHPPAPGSDPISVPPRQIQASNLGSLRARPVGLDF